MRVLVVEDDTDSREELLQLLRQRRFEVDAAGDGGAALDLVRTFHPDVVLLDLAMPRMGGDELVARLRDDPRTRDVAVIVMSAWARSITPPVQVDGWLPKPIDPAALFTALDRVSAELASHAPVR